MSSIRLHRHEVTFRPESARVIIRPFIPGSVQRITNILHRALAMSDQDAAAQLRMLRMEFASRHFEIEALLLSHFEKVRHRLPSKNSLPRDRQLIIGALFSGE
jgi:hypothetical protein